MTTHDPDTGQRDLDTLHGDQGVSRPGRWKDLMFGVRGEVERTGTIRVGDEVTVLETQPA